MMAGVSPLRRPPDRPYACDWNRVLSGLLGIGWLGLSTLGGGLRGLVTSLLQIVVPLACIWYPDILGAATTNLRAVPITRTSPGCAVRALGWAALLSLTVMRVTVYLLLAP
jgi:hypothetical protein